MAGDEDVVLSTSWDTVVLDDGINVSASEPSST